MRPFRHSGPLSPIGVGFYRRIASGHLSVDRLARALQYPQRCRTLGIGGTAKQ